MFKGFPEFSNFKFTWFGLTLSILIDKDLYRLKDTVLSVLDFRMSGSSSGKNINVTLSIYYKILFMIGIISIYIYYFYQLLGIVFEK
jgi:hypothetical protein